MMAVPNPPPAEGPVLQLQGIHTVIGQHRILQGVDLTVRQGQVTVLLGRNGAGKTTTLTTVMGLTPPARGSIRFQGTELGGLAPYRIARLGIGYIPEDRALLSTLTVRENLILGLAGDRTDPRHALRRCQEVFPELERFLDRAAGTLSGGERQMVAIARAVMVDKRLLVVDEPSKGLAPVVVQRLATLLRRLGETHAVLLVEQNLDLALAVGDTYCILDAGRSVAAGNVADLTGDPDTQRRFLGITCAS